MRTLYLSLILAAAVFSTAATVSGMLRCWSVCIPLLYAGTVVTVGGILTGFLFESKPEE